MSLRGEGGDVAFGVGEAGPSADRAFGLSPVAAPDAESAQPGADARRVPLCAGLLVNLERLVEVVNRRLRVAGARTCRTPRSSAAEARSKGPTWVTAAWASAAASWWRSP